MTGAAVEIRIPRELPHQVPVLASHARYKIVRAGRRWGKSRVALIAAVYGHGPGECHRGIADGVDVVWLSPDYPQSRAIWREEIRPRFAGVPGVDLNETERRIGLAGAGTLELRSAEAIDSLRGRKLGGVVCDEAAFMALEYALREVIRATLVDLGGWLLLISTPNAGQDGNPEKLAPSYFNRLCQQVMDGALGPDWAHFHGTTRDNPKLPPAEVEAMYAEYPEDSPVVAQELDAKLIVGGSGVAFPEWDERVHRRPPEPGPEWKWFGGFDWGYHPDPAAFVLLASGPDRQMVARFDCQWQRTTPYDVGRSLGLVLRDKPLTRRANGQATALPVLEFLVIDSAMTAVTDGGETIFEQFQRGLRDSMDYLMPPIVEAAKGPESRITGKMLVHEVLKFDRRNLRDDGSLAPFHRPRLIVHDDAPNLLRTLPTLPVDVKDPNKVDTDADDHVYDALRYALTRRAPTVDGRVAARTEGQHPGYDAEGRPMRRRGVAAWYNEKDAMEQAQRAGRFTTGLGLTGFHVTKGDE